MTIPMFYGLLKEYDGIHSVVEIIDICLIVDRVRDRHLSGKKENRGVHR